MSAFLCRTLFASYVGLIKWFVLDQAGHSDLGEDWILSALPKEFMQQYKVKGAGLDFRHKSVLLGTTAALITEVQSLSLSLLKLSHVNKPGLKRH